jgi:hypothetical protein
MRPAAYVSHHIPGRIRLKVPFAKSHPELFDLLCSLAAKVPGFKGAKANRKTGSILVLYDEATSERFLELLTEAIAEAVELTAAPGRRGPSRGSRNISAAAQSIYDFFGGLDESVREATDNELDLRVLLPVGVAAVALLTMRRRTGTPVWLTALIFAFNSFRSLHAESDENDADLAIPESSASNGFVIN